MRKIGLAVLFGALLTLPFAIMEFTFNGSGRTADDVALFSFLWIMATLLSFVLVSLVQTLRVGARVSVKAFSIVLRVAVLAVIVAIWGSLIVDQFPCFIGVPNCD